MPKGADGDLQTNSATLTKIFAGTVAVKEVRVGVQVGNAVTTEQLWIDAVAPTLAAISNQSVAYNAAVNIAVSATGTAPITYSATGLPTGLTINPSTGAITGQSTSSGTYSITVTATNAAGNASQSFTLTIQGISLTIDFGTLGTQTHVGNGQPFVVRFRFQGNQQVTGFTQDDISVSSSTFTQINVHVRWVSARNQYEMQLLSPSSGSGTITVSVPANAVSPANEAASATITYGN